MSGVRPPLRPPTYAQPIGGDDCFLEPTAMLDELVSVLTVSLDVERSWSAAGWKIEITAIGQRSYGQPLSVDFLALRNDVKHGGAVHLSVHPSGWIDAHVTVGALSRHAFIERNYEEFEIWPPGSPCTATDSGRMGKRCAWVQLQAAHWPDLAFLADGPFISIDPASGLPVRT
jgi:hypothetical protein